MTEEELENIKSILLHGDRVEVTIDYDEEHIIIDDCVVSIYDPGFGINSRSIYFCQNELSGTPVLIKFGYKYSWKWDENVVFVKILNKDIKINMRRKLILKEKINDFEAGEYNILTRNEIKKLIEGGAKWEREWKPEDLINDDIFYVLNLDGKVTSYRYKDNDPTCKWLLLTKNCYETEMAADIARQKIEEGAIEL